MLEISEEEQREIFSENLVRYVKRSGKQQKDIAADLGFNQKTFNGWCNRLSMPTMGKVQAIADYFGIGKSDLLDRKMPDVRGLSDHFIPILGNVAAGFPKEMVEGADDYIYYPDDNDGDYFALRIKGNSMEPRFVEGDIVIVRQQPDVENSEIAIVTINGDDATCKKVIKHQDAIMLVSFNPSYEPMIFSNEQVEKLPIKILGRVVELRAKF